MVKLQVMSDLHLEVGHQHQSFEIPVCAPYLVLAGDIAKLEDYQSFLDFLVVQCQRFKRVFLVLGNHEYYGLTWCAAQERAHQLTREDSLKGRLVLLDREVFELDENVVLLGCTLWSKINPESEEIVRTKVKDFIRIIDWSTQRHNEEHGRDIEWLQQAIQKLRSDDSETGGSLSGKKIIVVTHHAPIREGSSRPEHLLNPWTDAFATELLQPDSGNISGSLSSVNCWIFGHTHYSTDCQRGSVRVFSNQRGYVLPSQQIDSRVRAKDIGKDLSRARMNLSFLKVFAELPTWFKGRKGTQTMQHIQIEKQDAKNETTVSQFDVCRTIEI